MDALIQDLRYAARSLAKSPGFTAAAVACLALGIGANSAMFGVVDTLLFRPPAGVSDAGHLRRLFFTVRLRSGEAGWNATSYPLYEDLRRDVPGLSGLTAYFPDSVTVGRGSETGVVPAAMVAGSYFETLGVSPAYGRLFGPRDDVPGGAPVAVVSYAYWRDRLGGEPGAVGRILTVGGLPCTIVGVAPRGFIGPDLTRVDLWLPLAAASPRLFGSDALTNRDDVWLQVIGRLASGADQAQVAAQATVTYQRNMVPHGIDPAGARVGLWPIQVDRGPKASRASSVSVWLAVVAGLVLLIACANVATLLLVRGTRRRREIAVRLALGAGRARLAAQFLAESALLAALGAGAGLLLAAWGAPLIRRFTLPPDAAAGSVLDPRVLVFTAAVAVVTALISGLTPAWRASRPDLAGALKAGEREGSYQRSRLRSGLLVAQVALTLVLVVGTGLFVRSLRNVLHINLGVDTRRVLAVSLDFRGSDYSQRQINSLEWATLDRARAYPGVESAAAAMGGSFGSWSFGARVVVPGRDTILPLLKTTPYLNAVTPEYFATTGTRIVRGRGLTAADATPGFPVAVIDEAMADLLWPGKNPIGKCFKFEARGGCTPVVGIAADVHRWEVVEDPPPQFYVPLARGDAKATPTVLYLRTKNASAALAAEVRRSLQQAAGDGISVSVTPIESLVETQLQSWKLAATACTAFGALALLLAAFGLYAVLASAVAQRRQEMGVRLALGARGSDIAGLVVGQGMRTAALGILIGIGVTLAAGRLVASLLYGITPSDPLTLALGSLSVLAVTVAASWLPARRATRVDPVEALRAE